MSEKKRGACKVTIKKTKFSIQSARLEALPNAAAAADIVALTLVDLTPDDDERKVFMHFRDLSTILHHLQAASLLLVKIYSTNKEA